MTVIAAVIGYDRLQIDILHTAEDVFIDRRIDRTELLQQRFDFLPLGAAAPVVAQRAILREAAGALDKREFMGVRPGDDVLLVHPVQRADQLHAGEVL